MTVSELIKELSQYPSDMQVCDYDGNYVIGSHKVMNDSDDNNNNIEVQLRVYREEDF